MPTATGETGAWSRYRMRSRRCDGFASRAGASRCSPTALQWLSDRKIARFEIADLFDAILVEGELGFGKPDERVYRRALSALDVKPADAWMVGDNLEWDVAAPQKLGMSGVWVDARGRGLPNDSAVKPDYIVRSLADLRSLIDSAG